MQQIDLYLDEFRPQREVANHLQVLGLWVVVTALSLALAGYRVVTIDALRQQVVAAEQDLDSVREQKRALAKRIGRPARTDRSPETLASLEQQLVNIQATLTELERFQLVSTPGFSGVLTALAANARSDLTLDHIQVSEDNLLLSGETMGAEALPVWLLSLRKHPILSQYPIGDLKLERIEGDLGRLRFLLGSSESREGDDE